VGAEIAVAGAPPGAPTDRFRVPALIAGYGSIASALPYLALKIVWLTGGTLGAWDSSVMRDRSMIALNAVTAGMDLIAIGLALAFTHRWGLCMPAWLLLPPMWVASGLLATFVVGVPIFLIDAFLSAGLPRVTRGPVQAWVYLVVYTEFIGLGIGLMAAFFLYARRRWAAVLEPSARALQYGALHGVQKVLANAMAAAASVLAIVCLAWAFGATVGLPAGVAARRTIISALMNGIDAVLMLGAAAGILMMVHRVGARVPFWVQVATTWLGAGSMFGWGGWRLINVLGATALMRGAEPMPFVNLVSLLRLIVGLVLGLLMIFRLAELRSQSAAAADSNS
jgi:hypothetical protein